MIKSGLCFVAAFYLGLIYMSLPARADTVFLKNGKTLEVETCRLEGDQVFFVFKGMQAGIPQSKVERVEKSNGQVFESVGSANRGSADLNGTQFETGTKLVLLQNKQTAGAKTDPLQQLSSTPKPLVLQKNGLKNLEWNSRLSHLSGMEPKSIDTGFKNVVEYVRPQDPLKLGDIDLKSVVYAFWRDQLFTISIWTEGQENFNALRSAAFAQFGKGARIDGADERYVWTNDTTDVMLKYIGKGEYGLLWMRCKELDRKMKLSTLNHHTSFLKRMKSLR